MGSQELNLNDSLPSNNTGCYIARLGPLEVEFIGLFVDTEDGHFDKGWPRQVWVIIDGRLVNRLWHFRLFVLHLKPVLQTEQRIHALADLCVPEVCLCCQQRFDRHLLRLGCIIRFNQLCSRTFQNLCELLLVQFAPVVGVTPRDTLFLLL